MRFVYTPNLRQYDAGVMDVGHRTNGLQLVVPPHLDTFEVEAGCSADCLGGVSWSTLFIHTLRSFAIHDIMLE